MLLSPCFFLPCNYVIKRQRCVGVWGGCISKVGAAAGAFERYTHVSMALTVIGLFGLYGRHIFLFPCRRSNQEKSRFQHGVLQVSTHRWREYAQ